MFTDRSREELIKNSEKNHITLLKVMMKKKIFNLQFLSPNNVD